MNPLERFALWQSEDPDAPSPGTSQVIIDGHRSALVISGRTLLRQYETASGYLLVTDFDCPFDEAVCFVLISKDLQRVLGEHMVGYVYSSYDLDELIWLDEAHFFATFMDLADYRFYFTIRRFGIPWIYPRLGVACRRFHPKSGTWRRDIR
jgi:hypothetical protein